MNQRTFLHRRLPSALLPPPHISPGPGSTPHEGARAVFLSALVLRRRPMSGEPVGAAACGGGEARTVMKGRGKGTRGRGRGRGRGGGDRSFSAPAMNAVAVGDRVLRERRHPPNTLCQRDTDDDDEVVLGILPLSPFHSPDSSFPRFSSPPVSLLVLLLLFSAQLFSRVRGNEPKNINFWSGA